MEKKFRITECEIIPTEGTALSENFSLLNGSPVINYYESLKSPAISANVSFLDTDGVVSNESIMGGEMLRFTVDFGELGTFSRCFQTQTMLVVLIMLEHNLVQTGILMQYLLSLLSTKLFRIAVDIKIQIL